MKPKMRQELYLIARNAAIAVFLFLVTVAVIMGVTYLHSRTHPPVPSPRLEELIEILNTAGAEEELKEAVMSYDLMARRAHFQNLAFMRRGAHLFFFGGLLLIMLIKLASLLKEKEPVPGKFTEQKEDPGEITLAQQVILGAGIFIVATAFILSVLHPGSLPPLRDPGVTPASPEEMMLNWPSFRGYGGRGYASGDYPVEWDRETGQNIIWETSLPLPGVNSPVVWEGKVFLAGADESRREVYCIDAETGNKLWSAQTSGGANVRIPQVDADTGLAAPTVATDGLHLGAVFATGELLLLDLEGNIIREIQLGLPDNVYGHASSLIAENGVLFVQYDHDGGSAVMGYEMDTGRLKWRRDREVMTSWSSPVMRGPGDERELILLAEPLLAGYDPETGDPLWELENLVTGEIGTSCAFYGDRIYAANAYSALVCVDAASGEVLWRYYDDLPEASSPVARGGFLILPSSYERVSCLDAETGERLWHHDTGEWYYSSPVIAGDKVYLSDKSGVTHIFKLSDEYIPVSAPDLGERIVSTPAFSGGRIYIRGAENLYCIGYDGE